MGLTVDTRVLRKFKHLVKVCSAQDVVIDNGQLVYQKKEIFEGWAMIVARRAQVFDPYGQAILEERNRRTHFIHMRKRPDIQVTSAAWIYEEPRLSPPRWFKLLNSMDELEDGQFFKFECRLVEMGDDILKPIEPSKNEGLHGLLPGVQL